MAYAFNRVMNALGQGQEKDDPQQQQANIFAPQQPTPQAGGAPQRDRITTASTQGSFGPDSAGSSFAPQMTAGQESGPSSTGAQNQLISRNAGKVKSPVDLAGLSKTVQEKRDTAQQEADSYVAAADDRYETTGDSFQGGLDLEDLDNYVNGNPVAVGREFGVSDAIEQYQLGSAAPVSAFDPKADIEVSALGNLQNDEGLQTLFRQGADAEYGGNEAALDTALLRKNAGFNQERDKVLNEGRAMQAAIDKTRSEATGKAQKTADDGYNSWRNWMTDNIGDYTDEYTDAAKEREREFDMYLGGFDPADNPYTPEWMKENIEAIGGDASLVPYLGNMDPTSYYTGPKMTADQTSWKDFVSEDNAQNWGRVMSLLGGGGQAPTVGRLADARGGDYKGSFDANAYMEAVLKAARSRKAAQDAREKQNSGYGIPGVLAGGYREDQLGAPPPPSLDPLTQAVKSSMPWGAPTKEAPENDPILPDVVEDPLEKLLNGGYW